VLDPLALQSRLSQVRERIARAASRAKRDPASVRLIAVSKTFSPEQVRAVAQAGQVDFGENKVQEGVDKIARTTDLALRWHLIGHLQSNKARHAVHFHTIDSIDSGPLLQNVDSAAAAAGKNLDILVQIDLAQEPTKFGVTPQHLRATLDIADSCQALRLKGLMLLPPAFDNPEDARPYFSALRTLRDDLVREGRDPSTLGELSMGMSHDFEIAIEEGATMVRVGSALFGAREYR
jgi:pyridoxal phosphate enzyme (YggS family)